MDVLSEMLKLVTLEGAVFYNAEYAAPWCFRSPPSAEIAPHLKAEGRHVIIYHLVTEGRAWAQVDGGDRVELSGGDIVIFPHGASHLMGNGSPLAPVDHGHELKRFLSLGLEVSRFGGHGEMTRFVCGYMVCEPRLSSLALAGLPALFKVSIRGDEAGQWLENSILFTVRNAVSRGAGAEAVLAKLSETLFVETLRRYLAALPDSQTGWLAASRDAQVGRAIALLHEQPAKPWTIGGLAAAVGVSRAVLAQRFRDYLDEPPISYLTRWRMQLGAQALTNTSQSVAEIAGQMGYDSEAAFNRAFKRHFGEPPARFRKQARAGG